MSRITKVPARSRGRLDRNTGVRFARDFAQLVYTFPNPAYATNAQIASLSTTSAAALRAKGTADAIKNGTITASTAVTSDMNDAGNKIAGVALTTALWWKRTGDDAYLGPLNTYLLGVIKPPFSGQALGQYRAFGGLLAAIDIVRKSGRWNDMATLPAHSNITFTEWLKGGATYPDPLPTRALDTGVTQRATWRSLRGTCYDSASNWGGVARWAYLMWAVVASDNTGKTESVALLKKWLGDTTTGIADFKSTSTYLQSWNNWPGAPASGTNQNLTAGVGDTDAVDPGLDGVLLNDVDRSLTEYNSTAVYWGADVVPTANGITYSFENLDGVWPEIVTLINLGYTPLTWGEGGNAITRIINHLDRIPSPGGGNSFVNYITNINTSGLYDNAQWLMERIANRAMVTSTKAATASGVGGLPRTATLGDWIAEPNVSTWGVVQSQQPAFAAFGIPL